MTKSELPRQVALGVPFHPVPMAQALATIADFLQDDRFHLVVTLGTEMVMHAQGDPEFRQAVEDADLVVPDSVGVLLASRYCGLTVPERVAGIDLVKAIARELPQARFFLLGAAPGVAEEAAQGLERLAPGVQVVGTHHGYFQEDEPVVEAIRASGANVLLAALGFPRQEHWMRAHGPASGARVGIGVGGTLDVLSGRVRRAPDWMIGLGLEWFYRLAAQPKRWMRMLALPKFVLQVLASRRRAVVEVQGCER